MLRELKTKAYLEGDEWILNGSKCFITNGHEADIYVIIAVTDVDMDKKGRPKKKFSAFPGEGNTWIHIWNQGKEDGYSWISYI